MKASGKLDCRSCVRHNISMNITTISMSKLFSGDFTGLIVELTRLIFGFDLLHPPGHSRGTALTSRGTCPGLRPPLEQRWPFTNRLALLHKMIEQSQMFSQRTVCVMVSVCCILKLN